jgi:hypothetical protein
MQKQNKRVRLDMRFPEDLLLWAKERAKKRRITTTQLFVELVMVEMRKENQHG